MVNKKRVEAPDLTVMSATHLVCRDLMHAWEWLTDSVVTTGRNRVVEVTRTVVCSRCMTERRDVYKVPSFDRVSSSYLYPEGYLTHTGKHVRKNDVRREYWRRAGMEAK